MTLHFRHHEHHNRETGGGAGSPRSSQLQEKGEAQERGRDARLPQGTRRVLHLDVDAFLASVEQVLHPELRDKPVVIGGLPTDRNIVMSCSYDVRARGVKPGMILAEAARRCPEAIFRRGDSQGANRLREEVTAILMRYSPLVEVASIDDFFVELKGSERLFGNAFDVAQRIKEEVKCEVGLPLSIGVGTSRTMARLAGKLAKPGGIAEILPGEERAFLNVLPVEELPGVGYSTQKLLAQFAIRKVGQLALVSREVLFSSFGSLGLLLWERARGIDQDPVLPSLMPDGEGGFKRRVPSSIRRDSTFEPEEGRREMVEAMLSYLVERASHLLRQHGLQASSVEVRIIYVDTRPPSIRPIVWESGGRAQKRRKLPFPSDATEALWQQARDILRDLPRKRALVKRVGVTLVGLKARAGWQGELFSNPDGDRSECENGTGGSHSDRWRRLDAAVDRLRDRLGFGRILRGASMPLAENHELEAEGFRLRTPSLNQ